MAAPEFSPAPSFGANRVEALHVHDALRREHRLIGRMFQVIRHILTHVTNDRTVDPCRLDAVIDFIQVYADHTHHGKEEGIVFRELRKKHLANTGRQLMAGLIADHIRDRNTTSALAAANQRYRHGATAALGEITARLKTLIDCYPQHLVKEDEVFFPAVQAYFTAEENQAMLAEFGEYDRKLLHTNYAAVVEALAAQTMMPAPCPVAHRPAAAGDAR